MIEKMAKKLAAFIVANDATADFEIMQYGLELILQQAGTTAIALVIAVVLRVALPALVAIVCFTTMRFFAGGVHAQTRVLCSCSYFVFIFGIVAASKYLPISLYGYTAMYSITVVLLLLYAPADNEEMPIVEKVGLKKALSVFWATTLFGLSFFLRDNAPSLAAIPAYVTLLVGVLTHPFIYWLYKCKKHRKRRDYREKSSITA